MSTSDDKPGGMGARIAEAREKAGIKQTDLARAIGVEPWTISRWENGRQTPRGSTIAAIAKALGVDAGWIAGEEARAEEGGDPIAESETLAAVREMTGATDAELRWLAASPRFHRATVGSLIDALRADRQGMTPEQAEASREATERHRDPTVPRRKPR
jgi:transcriptional regulator with XRE-family HTH domain